MKPTRPLVTMIVGCTAVLGLTSCASGGPTYDFSARQIEPAKSLTITVPESLRKVVTGGSGQLIVDSYEIAGREIAGAELCAFDVNINYTDGGLDIVKDSIAVPSDKELVAESRKLLIEAMGVTSWETAAEEFVAASEEIARSEHESYKQEQAQSEKEVLDTWGSGDSLPNSVAKNYATEAQISFDDYLTKASFDSVEHFATNRYAVDVDRFEYGYLDDFGLGFGSGTASEYRSSLRSQLIPREHVAGGSMQDHLDRTDELIVKDIEANRHTPERLFGMDMRLGGNAKPMAEFDEAAPEEGFYVSEDFGKLTRVTSCALIPQDSENFSELPMNRNDSENGIANFATARVTVMKDGTVWTVGEVDGFTQDSNSNWVQI